MYFSHQQFARFVLFVVFCLQNFIPLSLLFPSSFKMHLGQMIIIIINIIMALLLTGRLGLAPTPSCRPAWSNQFAECFYGFMGLQSAVMV